jgi:hypothetical protein
MSICRWRDVTELRAPTGYAGQPDKHRAFALALVLDELVRHLRDLDDELRSCVLASCRMIVSQP